MQNKQMKLAFIGGGLNSAIGATHKIASQMDNKFRLVCGCFSRDEEINKQTAEKWHIDNYYSNYIDLLEAEKNNIDAVVILTPTNTHAQILVDVLKFNIPIICEKTLTISSKDANDIRDTLIKNKGFLLTTYNYTGYSMLREMKYMINNEKLGKILQINIKMPQESFLRLDNEGNILKPQKWRLKDHSISTISLDLGTHLSNMIYFLIEKKPLEVVAMKSNFGHHGVIDNINCLIKYEDNIDCQMWYSKSAIGHKNGLEVEIYGEKGSLIWYQMNPEFLKFNDNIGRNITLDRSSKNINIANQERYNRFKAGHPSGFIEPFANHYEDIHTSLLNYQKGSDNKNNYIFDIHSSIEDLVLMEAIEKSVNNKWEKVNVTNK